MRFLRILSACAALLWGFSAVSLADDEDMELKSTLATQSMNDPEWQQTIERMRAETKALLRENEKLNSEYEFLQEKAAGLKKELAQERARLKQAEKQKPRSKPASKRPTPSRDWQAEMSAVQEQISGLEEENRELESRLAEIKEKNRLWQIQVSTLENQKRDLSLDANYQETMKEGSGSGDEKATEDPLKAKLEKSLKQENQLKETLNKLSMQKKELPKETAKLKKENKELEAHIAKVKKQIAAQEKENAKRAVKTKKSGKGKGKAMSSDLARQKRVLEAEVADLTGQLETVNRTVSQSKETLEKKRKLMDQIMRLDAENQELRARIDGTSR